MTDKPYQDAHKTMLVEKSLHDLVRSFALQHGVG